MSSSWGHVPLSTRHIAPAVAATVTPALGLRPRSRCSRGLTTPRLQLALKTPRVLHETVVVTLYCVPFPAPVFELLAECPAVVLQVDLRGLTRLTASLTSPELRRAFAMQVVMLVGGEARHTPTISARDKEVVHCDIAQRNLFTLELLAALPVAGLSKRDAFCHITIPHPANES